MRLLLLLLFFGPGLAHAQAVTTTSGEAKLRVFLDFVEWPSDPAFFQQELPFVSHVRTRQDADVHVQVSYRFTGTGGHLLTMRFRGGEKFPAEDFSLTHVTGAAESTDVIRRALAQKIKLGLLRFVAATPHFESIGVTFTEPAEAIGPPPDPWNGWYFRIYTYGYFQGESQTEYANIYGSASVNKVTSQWKHTASLSGSYDENVYRYEDATGQRFRFTSIGRGQTAYGRTVKSLTPHASAALAGSVFSSTYTNKALEWNGSAGVEWSVWPYSESTTRLLTVRYWFGAKDSRYEEETIFFKEHERLVFGAMHAALRLTQRWGSVYTSLSASHYFHDVSKNQVSLTTTMSLRLFKGLSLELSGTGALIRDQLYLPARGATPEEILLRRKQLATDYQYSTSIGITYTFGSIYSDVVNPRFD